MTTSSTDMTAQRRPFRQWISAHRDLVLVTGLVGLVLAGLVGMALATGWQETLEQVRQLTFMQIALLLVLSLVNYGLRGLRWHLFAQRICPQTDLVRDMRHFFGGLAMAVTPGRLGELVRMRWLRRETGLAFEKSAPLMIVDRASDLSAMALLLAICLLLAPVRVAGAVPVALIALAIAVFATRAQLALWAINLVYGVVGRMPRIFARARSAARSLAQFSGAGILSLAAFIGAVGWAAEGYAFYLLMGWLGSDIGLASSVGIFVFATLAGGLTGAPGGVGGAEAAMVALLSLQGVPLEISLPATAIIRLTTLWFAIAIGLVVFPYAERKSKGALT